MRKGYSMRQSELDFILDYLRSEYRSHTRSIEHYSKAENVEASQKAIGWHRARISDIMAIQAMIRLIPIEANATSDNSDVVPF